MRVRGIGLTSSLQALLLASVIGGCSPSPPPPIPAPDTVPPPDPGRVESVLFLLGDAGEGTTHGSPILPRLQQDIERWAERLDADSSVAVLVLGDIVYPVGLHPVDHPTYDADTAVVMSQIRLVLGPAAHARGARMYFMPGNHDWGSRKDWQGFVRLRNLDEFLAFVRTTTGAEVHLVPEAGTGGPFVLDWGRYLRLLLLDTAWWLLSGDDVEKAGVMGRIEAAMESAEDREIVLAAHHPFRSVGPHGGFFNFWETAGARYLLARSGAILQDLTSGPYREMEYSLRRIFARLGPPLTFVGGHEHSLQVIESVEPTDPRLSLVSGSGSKITTVGHAEGLRYAAASPGYMRLVIEKDGGLTLFVEAAPPEFLKCGGSDEQRAACMAEGIQSFETVYSQRLR